ncbi:hypothetical protein Q5P01_019353 [Channa striata]|uniref:Uncharacterized protein n=1 Tax=Channa striata TaxID=64152 RepID=A0AA88M184_CHASR|nr:hypothetical protein Q5P01_019353 [Channa striata]
MSPSECSSTKKTDQTERDGFLHNVNRSEEKLPHTHIKSAEHQSGCQEWTPRWWTTMRLQSLQLTTAPSSVSPRPQPPRRQPPHRQDARATFTSMCGSSLAC